METEIFVEKTKDYDSLTYINGNRDVKPIKLKQLLKSFKERPNKIVILINNKRQIIDGQHRLEVARQLNRPVYLLHMGNLGLNAVQAINSTNNAWQKRTFLDSYAQQGVYPYVRFKEFLQENSDYPLAAALNIFLNKAGAEKSTGQEYQDGKTYNVSRIFEDGQLPMPDLSLAYENAGKIREYKEYYCGYNRRSFVATMISLFKNKNFDHDVMLRKMKLQPTAMVHCATIQQYRALIENIYNYKSTKKVSLRY